jgi:hypothetical protein
VLDWWLVLMGAELAAGRWSVGVAGAGGELVIDLRRKIDELAGKC